MSNKQPPPSEAPSKKRPPVSFGKTSSEFKNAVAVYRQLGWGERNKKIVEIREAAAQIIFREQSRRLSILRDRYHLDACFPGCDYMLAVSLADEFVPGFDLARTSRGRPRKWRTEPQRDESGQAGPQKDDRGKVGTPALLFTIEKMKEELGISAAEACKRLVRQKGDWHRQKPEVVRARYFELRLHWDDARKAMMCPNCGPLYEKDLGLNIELPVAPKAASKAVKRATDSKGTKPRSARATQKK